MKVDTVKWKKRCNKVRLRIKQNFGIGNMIRSYNNLWIRTYKSKIIKIIKI